MESMLNTGTEIKYEGGVVNVRRLGVIDVFKFAKLLSKVGKTAFGELASKLNSATTPEQDAELTDEQREALKEQKEERARQLGFTMFATLAEQEEDLITFLASLTDKKPQEFQFLPPDVAIEVMTVIVQGEDLKRFFDKARALATTFAPQQ